MAEKEQLCLECGGNLVEDSFNAESILVRFLHFKPSSEGRIGCITAGVCQCYVPLSSQVCEQCGWTLSASSDDLVSRAEYYRAAPTTTYSSFDAERKRLAG